jgi:RHS repeat-associated protein
LGLDYQVVRVPGDLQILTTNLLTGPGIDERFTRSDSVNGTQSFLSDALGSTLAMTNSSRAIQTQYTYDPFGNTSAAGASNVNPNPYQFTGRENDGTGLYYYRNRYYSPAFQRFVAEDPIGFSGGDLNLYAYALNAPDQLADALGLSTAVFYPGPDNGPGAVVVYPGNDGPSSPAAIFPATENTGSNNGGNFRNPDCGCPAPPGTYPVQPPVNTPGDARFGPYFYPIGSPGSWIRKQGIGIHGGDLGHAFPHQTRGCIRLPNNDLEQLHRITSLDPLTSITIRPR